MTFSATYERRGEWWIGYVAELPGANAQGHTLEEARESLREAVELIISAHREVEQRRDMTPDGEVVHEELVVAV
jgi:predicted RNase H-like HicB family nuclease